MKSIKSIFPTNEQIEQLSENWCNENAESYNAQNGAFIAGANSVIDYLKKYFHSCDSCGDEFIGQTFPMKNPETFKIEKGLIQCQSCYENEIGIHNE